MAEIESSTGFASLDNALIYYETAGQGEPFIMIHAGVADSRQWNNEFELFQAALSRRPLRHARIWKK